MYLCIILSTKILKYYTKLLRFKTTIMYFLCYFLFYPVYIDYRCNISEPATNTIKQTTKISNVYSHILMI